MAVFMCELIICATVKISRWESRVIDLWQFAKRSAARSCYSLPCNCA